MISVVAVEDKSDTERDLAEYHELRHEFKKANRHACELFKRMLAVEARIIFAHMGFTPTSEKEIV